MFSTSQSNDQHTIDHLTDLLLLYSTPREFGKEPTHQPGRASQTCISEAVFSRKERESRPSRADQAGSLIVDMTRSPSSRWQSTFDDKIHVYIALCRQKPHPTSGPRLGFPTKSSSSPKPFHVSSCQPYGIEQTACRHTFLCVFERPPRPPPPLDAKRCGATVAARWES